MTEAEKLKIHNAIRSLGKAGQAHLFTGIANEVNETSLKMKVEINEDLLIYNVRLRSIITDNTKGLWVIPKVGTKVTIGLLEGGTDYVLINASEIEKFFIKIGDKVFHMSSNGILMNGGSNGGLIKIEEMITQLNKLSARVDGIMDALNVSSFVPEDGGAAAFGHVQTALTLITDAEDFSNIENTDVKH